MQVRDGVERRTDLRPLPPDLRFGRSPTTDQPGLPAPPGLPGTAHQPPPAALAHARGELLTNSLRGQVAYILKGNPRRVERTSRGQQPMLGLAEQSGGGGVVTY